MRFYFDRVFEAAILFVLTKNRDLWEKEECTFVTLVRRMPGQVNCNYVSFIRQ